MTAGVANTTATATNPREAPRTPLKVVVVEDRATDAELMMAELQRTGFDVQWQRVDTQEDFVTALQMQPDIVLADYSLPQFDAIRALGVLWEVDPTIPLIVVTGQLGDEAAAECMKLGACDYVLKDRLARLGPAVEIALQQRRLDQERRIAEAALQESEERLKLVLEGSQNSFWDCRLDTGAVERSPQLAVMLGYDAEDIASINANWHEIVHPDDAGRAAQAFRDHIEGRTSHYEAEYRLKRRDGAWMWVLDHGRVVARDAQGRPLRVAGTQRDISEAKATRERLTESLAMLRALARRLQTVREEERSGIAREVHDVLGQEMTGLKMDVAWLASRLAKISGVEGLQPLLDKLSAMSDAIDTTIQNIRRISTELRPAVLDALGLVAALEWQSREFSERTGVRCSLDTDDDDVELDNERATAVFRIAQEALTNVTRHANATNVTMRLSRENGTLRLTVKDNGVGMTKNAADSQRSLGLLGMQERAMMFGGEVRIESEPGKGTQVTLRMPME